MEFTTRSSQLVFLRLTLDVIVFPSGDFTLLLFGASGFVGKHLYQSVRRLNIPTLATHFRSPFLDSVFFDCRQTKLADIFPKNNEASHAIILLGETKIEACFAHPKETYEINVTGIQRLVESLWDFGIKPVFISSEYVFDGARGNYTEEDSAEPTTTYGRQKLEVENYLREDGRDYLILRSPKVLGSQLGDGTLLTSWVPELLERKRVRCARDQRFSATLVDDMVAGMLLAVKNNLSGTFHLCSLKSYSRVEMIKALGEAIGIEPLVDECAIADFAFSERRPLDISMNPQKFIAATGYKFKTLDDILNEICSKLARGI